MSGLATNTVSKVSSSIYISLDTKLPVLDAVKAVVLSVDTSQLALGVLYVYPDNCGVHREVTFTAKVSDSHALSITEYQRG